MCCKVHPQDKRLLRIKICKWNGFQEQFRNRVVDKFKQ